MIIVANILQHTQGDDWLLDQNRARLSSFRTHVVVELVNSDFTSPKTRYLD
jgi:hypothetical protein